MIFDFLRRGPSWRVVASGSILALASLSQAQAHAPHDSDMPYPRATLSAQASADVLQDTVQITLAADLIGSTQQTVSEQLNTRLDAVMAQAKGHDGIQASSGAYRIWPSSDRDGRVTEWRGRAEILLKSRNFDAASQLAAQLSEHMPIDGLAFSVSRERKAAEEKELLTQAVQAFRDRAQALTQALKFSDYRLYTLDVGGSGEMSYAPAPRMMMSAMAQDKVAAPLEGGRQTLSVSVQGVIVLQPVQTTTNQSIPSE